MAASIIGACGMQNQEQGICPKTGKFSSESNPKQCFQLPELIHSHIASSSGIPDFDFCPNIIRRFGIPPLWFSVFNLSKVCAPKGLHHSR